MRYYTQSSWYRVSTGSTLATCTEITALDPCHCFLIKAQRAFLCGMWLKIEYFCIIGITANRLRWQQVLSCTYRPHPHPIHTYNPLVLTNWFKFLPCSYSKCLIYKEAPLQLRSSTAHREMGPKSRQTKLEELQPCMHTARVSVLQNTSPQSVPGDFLAVFSGIPTGNLLLQSHLNILFLGNSVTEWESGIISYESLLRNTDCWLGVHAEGMKSVVVMVAVGGGQRGVGR